MYGGGSSLSEFTSSSLLSEASVSSSVGTTREMIGSAISSICRPRCRPIFDLLFGIERRQTGQSMLASGLLATTRRQVLAISNSTESSERETRWWSTICTRKSSSLRKITASAGQVRYMQRHSRCWRWQSNSCCIQADLVANRTVDWRQLSKEQIYGRMSANTCFLLLVQPT